MFDDHIGFVRKLVATFPEAVRQQAVTALSQSAFSAFNRLSLVTRFRALVDGRDELFAGGIPHLNLIEGSGRSWHTRASNFFAWQQEALGDSVGKDLVAVFASEDDRYLDQLVGSQQQQETPQSFNSYIAAKNDAKQREKGKAKTPAGKLITDAATDAHARLRTRLQQYQQAAGLSTLESAEAGREWQQLHKAQQLRIGPSTAARSVQMATLTAPETINGELRRDDAEKFLDITFPKETNKNKYN